jgi:hypothetical protein
MAKAKIRVLRLLEYTYESVEEMEKDMKRWGVQGVRGYNPRCVIKSVTLPLEVLTGHGSDAVYRDEGKL